MAKKETQRMRQRLALLALGIVSVCPAQSPQLLFTSDERAKVLAFWADPTRYRTSVPSDAMEKGIWQVRLTTAGSQWIWNYNKQRKVSAPPTQNAAPVGDEQKSWEVWLNAKLVRDRWEAAQTARQANLAALGKDIDPSDKTIPQDAPPLPGPIPDALLALAGDPPKLAEAVVPMQHDVTFDDGTISYRDNIRLSNPRYAYYRFSKGVNSEGVGVKTLTPERLGHLFRLAKVSDSEAKIMRGVSVLEGGFDSINTYDTGYVSVGFIQFATLREGGGSLGAMMLAYKNDDPGHFQTDFRQYGVDVTPDGKIDVIDPATGAEVSGPVANDRVIEDKRLIAVFQHAGLKSDFFCAEQIRSAKAQFFPADDPVTLNLDGQVLTGKVSDFIKSEAGLATLMDRKVNTGKIDLLTTVATQFAQDHKAQSLADLCPYEREIISAVRYRKDYLLDDTLQQPTEDPARPKNSADRGGGTRGHRKTKKSGDG